MKFKIYYNFPLFFNKKNYNFTIILIILKKLNIKNNFKGF